MGVLQFGEEELGSVGECFFEAAKDLCGIFTFELDGVGFAAGGVAVDSDAWGRKDHSERGTFGKTFLRHEIRHKVASHLRCVVFGVDSDEVSCVSDVPNGFVPLMRA